MSGDDVRSDPTWMDALSEEQRVPVRRHDTHRAILASAGSGKTRTLVHMLASDLSAGVPPESIVAFTFTEKAADELLGRIHAVVASTFPTIRLRGLSVGTIHSWCFQYLLSQTAYYGFQPLDELHVDCLVGRLYDELRLEEIYGLRYPRGIGKFIKDLEVVYNEHLAVEEVPDQIRGSVLRFFRHLSDGRLMPFGGIVRSAIEHLQTSGPLDQLRALYVDEYQDVNPSQVELVKAMLPPSGYATCVGDDLQCIYQWRGSDVTRLLNVESDLPGASVDRLAENYRSRPQIVEAANKVAGRVSERDPKLMEPTRTPSAVNVIACFSSNSVRSQASSIAEDVSRFVELGVPPNAIAVLLRSVRSSAEEIVSAIKAREIAVSCPILGPGADFISAFLIPLTEWLSVEHEPPRTQAAEERAETEADALWASAKSWVAQDIKEADFWAALHLWGDLISEGAGAAYNVRSCLYDFLDRIGLHAKPTDEGLIVGLGIASQIIRSVEEIHRRRLSTTGRRTARGVMRETYFALVRRYQDFGESLPVDLSRQGVTVTTVHKSKGLEWPIVIVPMLARSRFPVNSSGHGTSFPAEIAGRYGTSVDDERRLFYVAVTRARERLVLYDPTADTPSRRSVFMTDLMRDMELAPSVSHDLEEEFWSIDDVDLGAERESPIRVSISDALLYMECPYSYGLRRVAGIQPSVGDDLGFGKGLHELIQRRLEADAPWDDVELGRQVDEHVFLPLMSTGQEAAAKSAITRRLKLLTELGGFAEGGVSEVEVELTVEGGVVQGIADSVATSDDGETVLRDWKSSIHGHFVERYSRQLQFYASALIREGVNVSRAEIVDLKASEEEGNLVRQTVCIDSPSLGRIEAGLSDAIDGIRQRVFEPTPSYGSCCGCDVRRLCAERVDAEDVE